MSERSFEEFLAELEANAADADAHEREMLESPPPPTIPTPRKREISITDPADNPQIPKPAPRFCRTCGAPLRPQVRFCTQCGRPVNA
jgi:hypothetical protein